MEYTIPTLLFPWQYTSEHVPFIELYTSQIGNRNSKNVPWFAEGDPDNLGISWWHVESQDKREHISKESRLFRIRNTLSSLIHTNDFIDNYHT